jgi:hypothetical protein
VITERALEDHFGSGNYSIVQVPSSSGDACHRNLEGIENKDSKKFQKNHYQESDVNWCMEGGCHPLDDVLDERLQKILPELKKQELTAK